MNPNVHETHTEAKKVQLKKRHAKIFMIILTHSFRVFIYIFIFIASLRNDDQLF